MSDEIRLLDREEFDEFLSDTREAPYDRYVRPESAVTPTREEFERMRRYLLDRYTALRVVLSFAASDGTVYDCVPLSELAGRGSRPPEPPSPARPEEALAEQISAGVLSQPSASPCPAGTVAIARTSLDTLTRFATLNDFLRKSPLQAGLETD